MSCDRKIGPYPCCSVVQGDCLELMRELPDGCVDVVITDPPYPDLKGGLRHRLGGGVAARSEVQTVGTPWGSDISGVTDSSRLALLGLLVFCSYHSVDRIPSAVPYDRVGLITWYKRNSTPPVCNVPHFQTEFIWAFKKAPGLIWRNLRTHYDIAGLQAGCMATERICRDGFAVHPAQKPLELMQELLSIAPASILDPYCGTGTTLVAAKKLGRHYLGFEISPEYCQIARDRLARIEAQPSLFEAPRPEQMPLAPPQPIAESLDHSDPEEIQL